MSTLTKCPYTLKPLCAIEETSREHIILDSIGGPDGYWVSACKKENNELGRTVDAAFQAEPLIAALASKIGVKTRSGVAAWSMTGELLDGNRPVKVAIPHQGPVEVFHRKPVEKDLSGNSFQIIAPPAQADKQLRKLETDLARKGKCISEPIVRQTPNQTIHIRLTTNLTVLNAGLMKIAYLACCELLGDSFLADPLNPEWQKAIRAKTAEDAKRIQIHGCSSAGASEAANAILPSLGEHEHGVAVLNMHRPGVVVVVRLFGSELLTVVAQGSETSNHGLLAGQGALVICNALGGAIRRERIEVTDVA